MTKCTASRNCSTPPSNSSWSWPPTTCPEQEIVRFNQEFNDRGLLAETDPADDWAADVGFE